MTQTELRKAMEEALGPHFKNYLPIGPIDYRAVLEIMRMLVSSADYLKGHIDMLVRTGQVRNKGGAGE